MRSTLETVGSGDFESASTSFVRITPVPTASRTFHFLSICYTPIQCEARFHVFKLRIHLDQWPAEDPQAIIRTAIHNYFAHRAKITGLEFKRLLRQGRTSLFIGLLFLAACLFLNKILLGHEAGTWAAVVRESLTIAGWVAMWRPMQIYLYDWWPLLQLRRVFTKLIHMPVEVVRKGKS